MARPRPWPLVLALAGGTLAVATYAISQVLRRCGHPALPLDDAFIHLQYARRIAEGHGLSYSEGDGFSSGATSLLWPLALSIFHALGLRELSLVWGAWLLGFAALAALALETYRIARPLTGRGEAAGASVMVVAFGGHVWCAASGMEVVPLAWLLAYAVRVSAEWFESAADDRSASQRYRLCSVALAAPLMRPEGALAALAVFAALVMRPAVGAARATSAPAWASLRQAPRAAAHAVFARRHAVVPIVGVLLMPLLNWAGTGHAVSSTTVVKWLPGNPYYGHGAVLLAAIGQNALLFFDTLLDGREWSALFVPEGARPFALAALVAIPTLGLLRRRKFRAALVLAMALGMLLPCTYLTFLWNRLRYLWPFAFAWFVGLACAARGVAELLGGISPRLRWAGPCLSFVFALALGSRLAWTTADLAESASAIDRQQVALARWAARTLPKDAVIGVNDTGAIAYLGGHKTFDVVGLTTPGEARYWVAGAGARFEHYERQSRADPQAFPSHFIVYPNWMGCDAVLGEPLEAATVVDQTILGGTTMIAFTARRDLLDSGALPVAAPAGGLIDELDVGDLESEEAHGYVVGPSRETDSVAVVHESSGRRVADGARVARSWDRFQLTVNAPCVVVARLTSSEPVEAELWMNETSLGSVTVHGAGWTEASWRIDGGEAGQATFTMQASKGGRFGSAHYWVFSP